MSRLKGGRESMEGRKESEFSNRHGLRKGLRNDGKKTKNVQTERSKNLGRNGRAAGNRDLLPPLLPLAAKQSVKARFLYYRRLIGFLKVKCTSASSLPLP